MIDRHDNIIDLNEILHPGSVYDHPRDVVADPNRSIGEKRAILASWASDACAVESVPALRLNSFSGTPVTFDDVMDALRALDACETETSSRYHRVLRKRRIFSRGSGESGRSPLQ